MASEYPKLEQLSQWIQVTGTLGNFTLNIRSGVARADALLARPEFSATGTGTLTILLRIPGLAPSG